MREFSNSITFRSQSSLSRLEFLSYNVTTLPYVLRSGWIWCHFEGKWILGDTCFSIRAHTHFWMRNQGREINISRGVGQSGVEWVRTKILFFEKFFSRKWFFWWNFDKKLWKFFLKNLFLWNFANFCQIFQNFVFCEIFSKFRPRSNHWTGRGLTP